MSGAPHWRPHRLQRLIMESHLPGPAKHMLMVYAWHTNHDLALNTGLFHTYVSLARVQDEMGVGATQAKHWHHWLRGNPRRHHNTRFTAPPRPVLIDTGGKQRRATIWEVSTVQVKVYRPSLKIPKTKKTKQDKDHAARNARLRAKYGAGSNP